MSSFNLWSGVCPASTFQKRGMRVESVKGLKKKKCGGLGKRQIYYQMDFIPLEGFQAFQAILLPQSNVIQDLGLTPLTMKHHGRFISPRDQIPTAVHHRVSSLSNQRPLWAFSGPQKGLNFQSERRFLAGFCTEDRLSRKWRPMAKLPTMTKTIDSRLRNYYLRSSLYSKKENNIFL